MFAHLASGLLYITKGVLNSSNVDFTNELRFSNLRSDLRAASYTNPQVLEEFRLKSRRAREDVGSFSSG
ncbi:hypothetical protein L596_002226 [Steinernema carpocapsae]|uniref:Uncharacterized protein n=1 Tax=Steinernema carpocapsae TaxID=34508 RepID=A0A4U8USK3_STECR|nr:hypothetical protein L596_002226 [Steinernema carpocapsae]